VLVKVFASQLLNSAYFWVGLTLRLVLLVLAVGWVQSEWFVPFLRGAVTSAQFLDPWSAHLKVAGDPLAFPYGLVMFFTYLPSIGLASILAELSDNPQVYYLCFGITTLLLDLAMVYLLTSFSQGDLKRVLLFYWLSPLVIYVCYWYGQLDLLPVVLLMLCLHQLKHYQAARAGLLLGLAISAKLSMLLTAPILAIYLWRNPRLRHLFLPFSQLLGASLLLSILPCFYSSGYVQMVLHSREIAKVYTVALDLGGGAKIYLLPVAYVLMLYWTWRQRRLSSELLLTLSGLAFFLVLLLTPASTGWFLWVAPFLVLSQIRGDTNTKIIGTVFSLLFVVTSLLYVRGTAVPLLGIPSLEYQLFADPAQASHFQSLLLSALYAVGLIVAIRMFIYGIQHNDFFRLSRAPLVIGIGGDSGSGKDTLVSSLVDVFGTESVTSISGDDYHKWNRRAPMWQALTHLDPRANDLYRMTRDIMALLDGKAVPSRHYNHHTGEFSRGAPHRARQVLLLSGLHVLYVPQVRRKLDVSIYLDMAQELRVYFKMKRDVEERGRSPESVEAAMVRRAPDAERYIESQSADADIVFKLQPADHGDIARSIRMNDFKLSVFLKDGVHYENIVRLLIGICGMRVDVNLAQENGSVELLVEGDVTSEDISIAANEITAEIEEFLALRPTWHPGMLGVMQFIGFNRIIDVLRERLLWSNQATYA